MLPRHLQRHRQVCMTPGVPNPRFLANGKLLSWYDLEYSTPNGSNWDVWTDVLGGSSITQTTASRRPAVGASANGLRTAVFNGTNVMVWPLTANNNATAKLGYWLRVKPASVSGVQRLVNITIATGGAVTFEKLSLYTNNQTLLCEVYATNTTGRVGATASNVLTAGAWCDVYLQYDSSRGGDANLVIYTDGAARTLNYTNIGAGATLGALQSPTGNAVVGAFNNTNTPVQALTNGSELGAQIFSFSDNLDAGEIAAFYNYRRPT